jgi:hypothetical protein
MVDLDYVLALSDRIEEQGDPDAAAAVRQAVTLARGAMSMCVGLPPKAMAVVAMWAGEHPDVRVQVEHTRTPRFHLGRGGWVASVIVRADEIQVNLDPEGLIRSLLDTGLERLERRERSRELERITDVVWTPDAPGS